jgi:hypothetical protein
LAWQLELDAEHDVHVAVSAGPTSAPQRFGSLEPASFEAVGAQVLVLPLPLLAGSVPPPQALSFGVQTLTCSPAALVSTVHVRSELHSFPFGHVGAQKISEPNWAQALPALQSLLATHAGQAAAFTAEAAPPSSSNPISPLLVFAHPTVIAPETKAAPVRLMTTAIHFDIWTSSRPAARLTAIDEQSALAPEFASRQRERHAVVTFGGFATTSFRVERKYFSCRDRCGCTAMRMNV